MIFSQNALAFLITIGCLVTFHELGHYLAARLCGVKVLRFSFGFGRVLFSRRFGPDQTEWAISMIPLGGYVSMLDSSNPDESQAGVSEQDSQRDYSRQPVWKRMIIAAAGPAANFVLALLLYFGLFVHGTPEPQAHLRIANAGSIAAQSGLRHADQVLAINGKAVQSWNDVHWLILQAAVAKQDASVEVQRVEAGGATARYRLHLPLYSLKADDLEQDFLAKLGMALARPPAILTQVLNDGPGFAAGLKEGDRILSVNGRPLLDGVDFVERVNQSPDQALQLSVLREQTVLTLSATPVADEVNGRRIGRLKVQLNLAPEMKEISLPVLAAIPKSVEKTLDTAWLNLKMIGKLLTGQASLSNVTGPITIADYAGQTARISIVTYISFLAAVSISLGVMNLLPVPMLDGGHLLYYSLELIRGKPLSERAVEISKTIGIALLGAMMALAFFNDFRRLGGIIARLI